MKLLVAHSTLSNAFYILQSTNEIANIKCNNSREKHSLPQRDAE